MPSPIRMRQLGGNQYPGIAAKFVSASTQYASVADSAGLSAGDTTFEIGCWLYMDSLTTIQDFIGKFLTTGSQREYLLAYNTASNRLEFYVSANGSGAVVVAANNFGNVPIATWVFVRAWHDAAGDLIGIQVNNGTANIQATTLGVFDGTAAFLVGLRGTDGTTPLNGRLDSVYFRRAISNAAEATRLYNNGVGLAYRDLDAAFKTGLVSWWDLDGNWLDKHGANHLTPVNNPIFAAGKR